MKRAAMAALCALAAPVLHGVVLAPPAAAGEVEEEVLLYPSYLTWDAGEKAWRGTVRGRVFEPGSAAAAGVARRALHAALGAVADPDGEEEERIFEERAALFAADSERGERVVVEIGGLPFPSRPSRGNGHFVAEVAVAEGVAGGTVPFRARPDRKGARTVEGTLRLLGAEGVSVISDVDDTVKDSAVLVREELVANTFYRPFRAIEGMPALYGAWRERGAAVHYVTASPWQLFPPLWEFLAGSGLGGVSIEMREVRLANASVVHLFRDTRAYKTGRIREILDRFPGRAFVLVGDSGERDPEIYAAIARERPGQVRGIFLRAVVPEHRDRSRYRETFLGVEDDRWIVFDDAGTLPLDLAEWVRGR